jgi:putative intracellular protease/amidase
VWADYGFDPTELAVPVTEWIALGHVVVFATGNGAKPKCDQAVLNGILGGTIQVFPEPRRLYLELEASSAAFAHPIAFSAIDAAQYDALFVVGGHAPGMNQMLSNELLHSKIRPFFDSDKPVASVCHGVLLLARMGLLAHRKTTALPMYLEWPAWLATHYLAGMGTYQLNTTWPHYVEQEIKASMSSPSQFVLGPLDLFGHLFTPSREDYAHAFVYQDGNRLSGRYWGDAFLLAHRFAEMLQ